MEIIDFIENSKKDTTEIIKILFSGLKTAAAKSFFSTNFIYLVVRRVSAAVYNLYLDS